ncbi:MAG: beta strand repeat-containing protein, partial [Dolichospermum sp.]
MISKVKGVSTTGLPVLRGMSVATGQTGSSLTISNNVIYNVISTYSTSNAASNNIGIILGALGVSTTTTTTTGGISLYHNSVNLYGSVDRNTGCLQYGLFVGANVTDVNLRNNAISNSILNVNASAGASKSYAIYSNAANTAYTSINYNSYYVSGAQGVLGFLTSDRTDLAGIQTGFGSNTNSITSDPLFNSSSILIPQTGSPLVGVGDNSTGITVDYLNVTRNNPPTIGAYETAGDFVGPNITYTNLTNEIASPSRTVTGFATITDASGINTTAGTKPRLYFKKSTDANAFVGNTSGDNGWKYVEATNAASPFDFTIDYSIINGGSVTAGNTIQYFVTAQDLASPVNVGISSSLSFVGAKPLTVDLQGQGVTSISGTPTSYLISATFSGTITVPGSYPSLTLAGGAFEAINNGVVTGNVNIEIAGDLTSETGLNALNAFSSPYTIKIYPTSVARLISGTASGTALISLNGADRVTIDGSIGGTGTDRSLTITQLSSTGNSANVFLASLGVGLGSTDNTIKNTVLVGASPTASSSVYGILIGGSTTATTSGNDNDNNTIQNNEIRNVGVGIFASGVSGNLMENTDFINNTIGNSVIGNSIGYAGLRLEYSNNTDITGNEIFNVVHSTHYDSDGQFGITAKNQSTNLTISKNKIYGLEYTGTSGYGAKGIQIRDLGSSSNTVISNNLVYDIDGDGWNDISVNDQTAGINLVGTQSNISIYNNSVYLGSGSFPGNTSGLISGALVIVNTGSTVLDIRNNIFSSNLVNTAAGTAKTYAIYSVAPNTSFTNINNNNYYVSGSQG